MVRIKRKALLAVKDPQLAAEVERELAKLRVDVILAETDALRRVFDEVPHLVVIDEEYSDGSGLALAAEIKKDVLLKYIPILFVANDHPPARHTEIDIETHVRRNGEGKTLAAQMAEILARNYNELDLNPLTKLPGIRSSVLRMEDAVLSKKVFAVCCLDLSSLEVFNCAYGDARGDQVIIRLSEIVQDAVRTAGSSDDYLGHLGGDDFVIVTKPENAVPISEEIIRHFDEAIPNFYDAKDRKQGFLLQRNRDGLLTQYPMMSVSIAVVQNDVFPIEEISEISHIAGELQRHMKSLPGSCYMRDRRLMQRSPEPKRAPRLGHIPGKSKHVRIGPGGKQEQKRELFVRHILRAEEVRTVYQPIVSMQMRKVIGYEALTWGQPGQPFTEPALIFGTARELGRVKEVDRLCVERALRHAQGMSADKKLFLNLNHETLLDVKFMKSLFSAKGVIGLKNIVIELTEESILRSFDRVRDVLVELREQGLSVAIDDVGGGAVSLRDVSVLRPDFLKFDRSLIRQIEQSVTKQQILLSMILFANGIQCTTVAEGIETREEYECVLSCGAELGQGYYFARPGDPFPAVNQALFV